MISPTRYYMDYYLAEMISESKEYEKLSDDINERVKLVGPTTEEQELIEIYKRVLELEDYSSRIKKLTFDSLQLADQAHVLTQSVVPEPKERKFSPICDGATVAIRRTESPDDEWMLGLVVSFDPIKMEYMIEDISEDEEDDFGRRKRFTMPWKLVQPLPDTDSIALKQHEFHVGQYVLALFPTTTCLYLAKIIGAPVKKKKSYEYYVQFENDEIDGIVPTRPVPARYVLEWNPAMTQ